MTGTRLAYLLGQAAHEFRLAQNHARSAMQREYDEHEPNARQHAAGREDAYNSVLRRLKAVIEEAEDG